MNARELESVLRDNNVSPEAYCLTGGHPEDRYVLSPEPSGKWAVYYSERGERNQERFFDSEDSACRYLLRIILEDSTTRNR